MASVPEAASALGVSERFVRMLLQRGELAGHRVGKSWVVEEQDLRRLLADRLRRPLTLAAGGSATAAPARLDSVSSPAGVGECSCGARGRVEQLEDEVARLARVVAELADLLGREVRT